jgi:ketosteroid isomerase-like protein
MTSSRTAISIAAVMIFGVVTPASTQQNEQSAGGELFEKVQSEFAQAYNRKDIAAMAAFFSENGVRITPAGVFRGREAIGRNCKEW